MPRRKQPEPHKSGETCASTSNITAVASDILEGISRNDDSEGSSRDDGSVIIIDDEQSEDVSESLHSGADIGTGVNPNSEDSGGSVKSTKKRSTSQLPRYGYFKGKRKKNESVSDPCLQEYLDYCHFYLTVLNTFHLGKSKPSTFPAHLLGSIDIKLATDLDKSRLEDSPVVYLYVSRIFGKCILYLEDSSGVLYWQVWYSAPYSVMESIKNKHMFSTFLIGSGSDSSYEYRIDVFIESSGFHIPQHPSDITQNLSMLSAIEYFLKISVPEFLPSYSKPQWPHKTNQELFDDVRLLHLRQPGIVDSGLLSIDNLLPQLRPYQHDAVRWMLTREKGANTPDKLHQLYMELRLPSGQLIYFNMYSGIICVEKPAVIACPLGGILADEMGLGKTVEVLALILSHPRLSQCDVVADIQPNNDSQSSCDLRTNSEMLDETEENKEIENSKEEEASDSDTEIVSNSDMELSDYEPDSDFKASVRTVRTRNSEICKTEEDSVSIDFVDELFECLCGQERLEWDRVQCTHCGSWQHKFCMDFDDDMDESEYLCPHCWVSNETPLVQSRATLVVTPSSIHGQWKEEIERHLKPGSLKWTFYPGMGQLTRFMQPLSLADHDLVLITYETLRKEIDYVDLPHSNSDSGRRLRNPKRFMAIPTPLLAVEWWRVCLDEAQMVEGVTTKTAEMALRLSAVNRWCVTGTPIQKSIDDLYGLLLFLGEDPYWQRTWWKRLLYDPYRSGTPEALLTVLGNCFWRNTKKDVLDQIGLPPQSEVTYTLVFSPVEEHFYKLQYQQCSADALRKLNKFHNLDIKLKELDKQTMAQVMGPLVRLRQACCHPHAVRGHLLPLQKTTITMEELLTSLIKKTKLECEDFHRQFICALNGLAGIHIINGEISEAVEKYREVLRAVKEQKDVLKTDKIQQFHTLYNLNLLLGGLVLPFEEGRPEVQDTVETQENRNDDADGSIITQHLPANVGRTLEDDKLQEESEKLRNVYIEKCQSQVAATQAQLVKAIQSVQEIKEQFYDEGENWWMIGCKEIIRSQTDEALVFKVKDALSTKETMKDSLSKRFNTLHGLMLMFTKLLDALKESHQVLIKAINLLSSTPTQDDVNAAITCHLRPLVTTIERCVYCRCHELFNHYEGLLFCFDTGFEKDPLTNEEALWGQTRKGTWADSELECALKTVLAFIRSSRVSPSVIENGNLHMKLFEARKKEFRCLRGVWMQIRDHASALDELEMGKIRFRLRLPDEPKPDIPLPYILEQEEVQPMKLKLMSDRAVAQNDLRKKLGQLVYLQNLQKADSGRKGGSNCEPCPICQKMLGTQWSVMQCGHCFCVECIRVLIVEYSVGFRNHSVRCAVCRQITAHAEITYVNTSLGIGTLDEKMELKGSHSTKVEAVIRCLLTIKKNEPEAKSLVFSSWQLVLNILEDAFTQNGISCVILQSHSLQKSLWQFKHNPVVHVLLLPVHSGANGLNLIEATHVLMVEPLLNPAAEVQALGRVHRIGQTKPTTVHRFIVSSTIEERIHQASTTHSDDTSMTIGELKKLFEVE